MDGLPEFTVCALLYGGDEYHYLHRRCLQSLHNLPTERCELRIAFNSVTCEATWQLLEPLHERWQERFTLIDGPNTPKYRRMRELLDVGPVGTVVMWFDDDSYLDPEVTKEPGTWLSTVANELQSADMIGSMYRLRAWRNGQRQWIEQQPWYRGQPVEDQPSFITGGWWAARRTVLAETGWPWPALSHNGGDVMLGVCLKQLGLTQKHFRTGVHINADADGRESASKRRGLSEPPLGTGWSA